MKPERRFLDQPKHFWANVRSISQCVGYTTRKTREVRVPSIGDMTEAIGRLNLSASHIIGAGGKPTALGHMMHAYFEHRAAVLNNFVRPRLLDAKEARTEFYRLRRALKPKCPLPMNKQKGRKKAPAYFTGIVNMLIEASARGLSCDYDPRELTTFTRDGAPLRTLARRIDGAFPSTVNPIAVWEIKEYYYTTTFGSRIADAVYETLLDGMELQELRDTEGVDVKHYLMLDARYTWWECGRSYLCRIIDMLHMGYVSEVLFGAEVIEGLPAIVKRWVTLAASRNKVGS